MVEILAKERARSRFGSETDSCVSRWPKSRPPRGEMCIPRGPVNAAHADEMLRRIPLAHARCKDFYNSAWPMNMLSLTSATTSLLSSLPTITMPLPPRVPFLPTLPSRWMKSMVVCGTS